MSQIDDLNGSAPPVGEEIHMPAPSILPLVNAASLALTIVSLTLSWYLVGLGATAILFALLVPRGIWGTVQSRFGLQLLPVGYRLRRDG